MDYFWENLFMSFCQTGLMLEILSKIFLIDEIENMGLDLVKCLNFLCFHYNSSIERTEKITSKHPYYQQGHLPLLWK